jgi:D-serine deaminase-like pyridoxal phosphate-dependent protein
MPVTKVKLNRAGIKSLMRSPEVLSDLEARAKRVASAAGEGFEADSGAGPNRARASVRTVTFDAMRAEGEDRALTRALDSAR